MKMEESFFIGVEKTVGKAEIAHYEQYLPLPPCFQKDLYCRDVKTIDMKFEIIVCKFFKFRNLNFIVWEKELNLAQFIKFVNDMAEKILGKGENAAHQHFPLFP